MAFRGVPSLDPPRPRADEQAVAIHHEPPVATAPAPAVAILTSRPSRPASRSIHHAPFVATAARACRGDPHEQAVARVPVELP